MPAPKRSMRGTWSTSITSACTGPFSGSRRPGNQDYRSLVATVTNPMRRRAEDLKRFRYRDFVEQGYVIAGSPATVRDRLKEEVVEGLRVGNPPELVHIGPMPHAL